MQNEMEPFTLGALGWGRGGMYILCWCGAINDLAWRLALGA